MHHVVLFQYVLAAVVIICNDHHSHVLCVLCLENSIPTTFPALTGHSCLKSLATFSIWAPGITMAGDQLFVTVFARDHDQYQLTLGIDL